MGKRRYRKKQTSDTNIFSWIYFGIFAIITLWLLSSIYFKKSPTKILQNWGQETDTVKNTEPLTCDSLLSKIELQDLEIQQLRRSLSDCVQNQSFPSAMINIDNSVVNMRSEPSLNSDILLKLKDSSEVKILYYDTESFFLEGKEGKWCKIRYANKEGWVWGNFLEEL
jgi:uncharacterized protein YgiM (DUF1202 family)